MSFHHQILFNDLPLEIQLHILGFVDSTTRLKALPLVNKEWHALSQDYSLYKHYQTASFDYDGVKTKHELSHNLFRRHLKVLVTDLKFVCQLNLSDFQALEVLNIHSKNQFAVSKWRKLFNNVQNLRLKRIDVRGEIYQSNVTRHLIPVVAKVENVLIKRRKELEYMFAISANRYTIVCSTFQTLPSAHGSMYYPSIDEVATKLQENGDDKNTNVVLKVDARRDSRTVSDVEWNTMFSDMLVNRIVSFSWSVNFGIDKDKHIFELICHRLFLLEDLTLYVQGRLPRVSELATKSLKTLSLKEINVQGTLTEQFNELLVNVKTCLKLERWVLSSSEDPDFHVQKLVLNRCQLPSKTLLKFLDKCDLSVCNQLTIVDDSFFFHTHMADPAIMPKISRLNLHKQDNFVLDGILTYLSRSRSLTELELVINTETCEVNSLLQSLRERHPQLQVLRCDRRGEQGQEVTNETLELVKSLTYLNYFYIECRLRVRFQDIRRIFSSAIISMQRDKRQHYPNFTYYDILSLYP